MSHINHIFYIFCKIICSLLVIIITSAYMSFIERRLLGLFQNRYGPNTVGWFGSLQIIADIIKMIFKEDWIPPFSNGLIFTISPIISFFCFLVLFIIIPISPNLVILHSNIGILFFLMIAGLSNYSVLLAGWASNNKYALIGAIRSSAQMLSYEVFLGLSTMGVIANANSFDLYDIIDSQTHIWNILPQFLGFITFFIASLALLHRHPFDQPEAEQEISDGYRIEYSGIKFGLFFFSEYLGMISVSSLIVILFLGGWNGPVLSPIIWFLLKDFLVIILFILIRASLPRPRYDQLINFSWKICFPLSLFNLLFTALIILLFKCN